MTKINQQGIIADNIQTSNGEKYLTEAILEGVKTEAVEKATLDAINAKVISETAASEALVSEIKVKEIEENLNQTLEQAIEQAVETATTDAINAKVLAEDAAIRVIESVNNLPVGTMLSFGGNEIPEKFLICDGSNVSRETYSELFKKIGTTWNNEEDTDETLFRLPNLIDRVIWGGVTSGAYKTASLPNITGEFSQLLGHNNALTVGGAIYSEERSTNDYVVMSTTSSNYSERGLYFDASKSNEIYNNETNTVQPPAAVCIPIIKYQ